MPQNNFLNLLLQAFSFEPTESQVVVLQAFTDFIFNADNEIFILKGFAGTGKTSLISSLVKVFSKTHINCVLLAPTGRAAKVFSEYSGEKAYTIHKHIYHSKTENSSINFSLKKNKSQDTIYIVDEASMISNSAEFERNSILEDLIDFIFSGKNSRLVFVGDTAQLPPVGETKSPALDSFFVDTFGKKSVQFILKEVVRQKKKSGILLNATRIRKCIEQEFPEKFRFKLENYKDIILLEDAMSIQEALENAYLDYGIDQTCFIVHSNKRAGLYNRQIRSLILGQDYELSSGDKLMVVKNNYFWLPQESSAGFIANGDTIEVLQIYRIQEVYGFQFAEVQVKMTDYPELDPFDTMLILDIIDGPSPALTYDQANVLYNEILLEYEDEISAYKKYQKIKENPFFNALQVKYSYAITCHKSQGGQWDIVFVEKPYLPNGVSITYLRWLYTAITRAKKRVYLIGF